ncbi:DUF2520 domain-containing protein [bacterium]|nr:DUF2520 domain-containing protein [candidate division CSSED10-310 bacterium]
MQFIVIGAGNMGTAIGTVLLNRGWECIGILDLDPDKAAVLANRLDSRDRLLSGFASIPSGGVIWLCVQDDAIAPCAASLAAAGIAADAVIHCSGLKDLSVLRPLEATAGRLAGLHPLTSVRLDRISSELFAGVPVIIETAGEHRDWAADLARVLGGRPFFLEPGDKPLYHAAAVMLSNLLISLLQAAASIMNDLLPIGGSDPPSWLPLVRQTFDNILAAGRPMDALTGPLLRADIGTLEAHRSALLARRPELWPLYRELSLYLLAELTREQSSRAMAQANQIAYLLRSETMENKKPAAGAAG